ncbi:SusC/RagA family TonB-linked outer membrane protein [Chitinophaga japonensis]|uniref:TonB-linked SusC/RagA family outer membrane protein n=1 Tax=Chitinophaga japonensis TaxID=104662 RepID=A0A562T4Q6_CHIJA|nr:TonB-dependent receptor [Chitinophaga japonensis]TWI88527.1 TonB-linked SusC/RagA family outer membrane protein [Chitinophaga japonensis]
MKRLLLLTAILYGSLTGFAQSRQVTGTVTSKETGDGLPGVTVRIKNTSTGATTDVNGRFALPVKSDQQVVLVFSYIGYENRTLSAAAGQTLQVQLQAANSQMNEVVVVGYGTVPRGDFTGAVSSLNAPKELKDIPANTVAEALAGRLAGVQVTTTEGKPGAEIMIRVRGGGSITQDNSPLYIVDGIQVEDALSLLSPQEIQSIDVLKDAASTAIYGARGANGVVIITTKGGKAMKTKVSYDGYAGIRKIVNKLDVLEPYDYAMYQYKLYNYNTDDLTKKAFRDKYGRWEDLELYRDVPLTTWQDEVFGRDAWNKTHVVTVSGGSKTTTFNLTLNNVSEDGIMLNSGYRRTMGSFKFDHKATDRLRIGLTARYSRQRIDGVGTSATGSQGTNRLRNAVRYKPFIAPGDEDMVDVFDPEYANLTNLTSPVLLANNELRYDYRNDVNLSGYFSYNITKQLTFRSVTGITGTNRRSNTYNGKVTSVARSNADMPVVVIGTGETMSLTNSNTLNYKNTFNKKHNLDVLAGQEIYQQKSKSFNSTVKWMPVDLTPEQAFAGIQKATPPTGQIQDPPTTSEAEHRLISFFGRVNYAYDGRYLATFTARQDGSSKFLYENGFAFFPSVALAWRASQERFLQGLRWLSDLKLRVSIGTSGNNRIGNDLFKTMYGTSTSSYAFEEAVTPGLAPLSLSNPRLKWETTVARNLGLDFGLFNSRINGSIDLYRNSTRDLLLGVKIPTTTGYTDQIQNVGRTQNTGIELQLSAVVMNTRNFTWNASFNIASNRNKIVSLGIDPSGNPLQSYLVQSGWVNSLTDFLVEVGQPIGQFYGYVTDGYYTIDDFDYDAATQRYTLKPGVPNSSAAALGAKEVQPGDLKLKKLSKDSSTVIGLNDRTVLGNAQPKFYGGLNQQFAWKGFDLSIFVNFSYGNKVYNANKIEFTTAYLYKDNNLLSFMKDSWKWYDDNGVRVTDPEQLRALNKDTKYWSAPGGNYFLHSFAIEDGSFLRISNVTIGYSLPERLLKRTRVFSRFRIYATVNNLHTFTRYTGYDPEANTRRNNPLTPGVDYAAYPRSRFVLAGVNVSF